jgi:threonine dehydratase
MAPFDHKKTPNLRGKTLAFSQMVETKENISKYLSPSPLARPYALSLAANADVSLKLESLQPTGSFKIRGAFNKVSSLTKNERKRGIITASAGNHGIAVSYAAKKFGIKAIIYVPEKAVKEKVDSIRRLGARVVKVGKDYDDAEEAAQKMSQKEGYVFIHAFEDPLVIAGQGTIAFEILDQNPGVETVIVPVGGGGLISGIAKGMKSLDRSVKVIGVCPSGSPAVYDSWKTGGFIVGDKVETIADGLAGRYPGKFTLSLIRKYVDELVLVSDRQIVSAMLTLLKNYVLAEPSAAASLAALQHSYKTRPKEKVTLVISGANVSMKSLAKFTARAK